jgi:hypothetical protein
MKPRLFYKISWHMWSSANIHMQEEIIRKVKGELPEGYVLKSECPIAVPSFVGASQKPFYVVWMAVPK